MFNVRLHLLLPRPGLHISFLMFHSPSAGTKKDPIGTEKDPIGTRFGPKRDVVWDRKGRACDGVFATYRFNHNPHNAFPRQHLLPFPCNPEPFSRSPTPTRLPKTSQNFPLFSRVFRIQNSAFRIRHPAFTRPAACPATWSYTDARNPRNGNLLRGNGDGPSLSSTAAPLGTFTNTSKSGPARKNSPPSTGKSEGGTCSRCSLNSISNRKSKIKNQKSPGPSPAGPRTPRSRSFHHPCVVAAAKPIVKRPKKRL